MLTLNRNPSPKDLRTFGLLLGLFLPTFGWLVCRKLAVSTPWGILAVLSATSIVAAIAAPWAFRGVYIVWTTAVFPIGWVVSHFVLAIVYWGVITPIGLTLRLLGRDPMQRGFDPRATTYWQRRAPRTDPKSYFRPF